MSLDSALRFLEESRIRPALRLEIDLLAGDAGYPTLCELGSRNDYHFTPAELARAFAINWLARWAHYARENMDQEV